MEANTPIETLSGARIRELIAPLSALFSRIIADGASMSYLAPLLPETADAYWRKIAADVDAGERVVLVVYVNGVVAGSVQLALSMPENGTHRADLQKLMVHPDFQRRGLGAKLMRAAESAAKAHDRRLIVLDTQQGSVAETFYETLGYQRAGVIPNYALYDNGILVATVLFYRDLG